VQASVKFGRKDGQGHIGEVSQLLGLGACSSWVGGDVKGTDDLPALDGGFLVDCSNGRDVEARHILGDDTGEHEAQDEEEGEGERRQRGECKANHVGDRDDVMRQEEPDEWVTDRTGWGEGGPHSAYINSGSQAGG
jgi:hypothetical protein